jgi:hypothetical protein
MRYHSREAKVARLRAGESSDDEATVPAVDTALDSLCKLRVLDERIEAAGNPPLLDTIDRRILDEGMRVGRIDCTALAAVLKLHRSTVWRRVQRMLASELRLSVRARILLGEGPPPLMDTDQGKQLFWAMVKTYAWGGIGPRPDGALALDSCNTAAAVCNAAFDARRLLNPPIYTVERHGGRLIITGPGPLDRELVEAVRSGQAERIFPGPPRCRSCGRLIRLRATGRPPKYCRERCRNRYRRRPR